MNNTEIKSLLENVPDSYDDFVSSVSYEMEQDENVREAVMNLLHTNPDSTTSDVLKVLCKCLGMYKLEAVV